MQDIITELQQVETVTSLSTGQVIGYAAIAGVLGLCIALTYMMTGKISKNFARTLIILPMLVCVVMVAVNGNLGASVAVLGAFSLVRFRSLQGTSREIGFIFFAMTVGITCSIGQEVVALLITVIVCLVHIILDKTHFAEKKCTEKELRITIPENLDYNDIFDDIFMKFTKAVKLVSVKTTNMGSLYEITYHIEMIEEECIKEMIDEIRCRNGNLNIVCGRRDYNPLEEL